jgi:D-beta-D-heptose 7-phosphate kinase/D-beta-D-heptose 1-phosphate adenosyltransferase
MIHVRVEAGKSIRNAMENKKKIVVAVSGGFDPIHVGHVRYINEAKALGDELVVILNNDNWLNKKKGYAFMPELERKEVIEAIRGVDRVVLTKHVEGTKDMSVCDSLREIKPDIFANGGDRKPDGDPVPEVQVCAELGIEMVYNVGFGGKVQSSSWLVNNAEQNKKK